MVRKTRQLSLKSQKGEQEVCFLLWHSVPEELHCHEWKYEAIPFKKTGGDEWITVHPDCDAKKIIYVFWY